MKKLPCPENIPLQWELFRGFGRPEVLKTVIVTGVVLPLSVLYSFTAGNNDSSTFISVGAVILTLGFCVGLFGKVESNQSIWDYLMRQLRFQREQQKFLYHPPKEVIRFVAPEEEN